MITKKVENPLSDGTDNPRNALPTVNDEYELEALVAELNQTHAVVMISGKCMVLTKKHLALSRVPSVTYSTFNDFKNLHCTKMVKIGMSDQRLGHAWSNLPKGRLYYQVVFDPGNRTNGTYDLWQGFAVKSIKGDCPIYLAHIRDIIASGNKGI